MTFDEKAPLRFDENQSAFGQLKIPETDAERGLRKLKPAAGAMIVVGSLNLFSAAINLFSLARLFVEEGGVDAEILMITGSMGGVGLLVSIFTIFAGTRLYQARSKGIVIAGLVGGCIPLIGCCFPLGLGVGIWALVVMESADGKAAFSPTKV